MLFVLCQLKKFLASIDPQLKEVQEQIDRVTSQIEEEKKLALEARKSGDRELFTFYNKSLGGLQEREKGLREKELKLLDSASVRTKEPSAGTSYVYFRVSRACDGCTWT
jgi:hypothetical protein